MKKLAMVFLLALVASVSFGQNYESIGDYQKLTKFKEAKTKFNKTEMKSLGISYGQVVSFRNLNFSSCYGGFVDFGNVGFEYYRGATVENMDYDFSTINVNKITGGSSSHNFGFFVKDKGGFYLGGGIQIVEEISAENLQSQNGAIPTVVFDKKNYPYISTGYLGELNEIFCFKIGGLFPIARNFESSATVILSAGIGIRFK